MRPAVFAVNREAGRPEARTGLPQPAPHPRDVRPVGVQEGQVKTDDGQGDRRLDGQCRHVRRRGRRGRDDQVHVRRRKGEAKDANLRMTQVAGMIFNQKPDAVAAGHLQGDRHGRQRAGGPGRRPGRDKGYTVTTVSGVKVDLADDPGLEVRLRGRGDQVSCPTWTRSALDQSGTDPEHYQRDKNLDKRPIRLLTDPAAGKKETFPKGLTLQGQDDDHVRAEGAVQGVPGDRRGGRRPGERGAEPGEDHDRRRRRPGELFKGVVKKGDKPLDLNLNVQNVDRLRITVESDGTVTDLGNQVSLANARVLK